MPKVKGYMRKLASGKRVRVKGHSRKKAKRRKR
jgi:hypothetical protein